MNIFKKNAVLTAVSLLCFLSCSNNASIEDQMMAPPTDGDNPPVEEDTLSYGEKAKATYDMIQKLYKSGDLYKENFPQQTGDNEYSYLWPYVGMLTAGNILYELGYDKAIFEKEFSGLNAYYDNRNTLPTYQAYPTTGGSTDHYYDDASIVVMELLKAYSLTKEAFYLERAKTVTDFIMSGEDSRMGGGLYWFEGQSKNCTEGTHCIKAANTSAYAAYITTELYKLTKETRYLTFAESVYQWVYNTLRDPSDNLYWNDINIGTEEINTTKWTYNAGLMIMSGINLYEITGEQMYLDHSINTARGAYSKFTKVIDGQFFYQTNDPWFNVELLSAFIQLAPYDSKTEVYIDVFIQNMDYAWEHARNDDGQFYEDWSGNRKGRYYWLLHQAALIEAYGNIALYKNEMKEEK
ncbi:glycoside hydrolase family 76 protein [Galbibacter sp. PAP.153]|uniref:glycoside hydrolase family 76 protein n=1 Tax=Galbibacter sp. PAP.153 TaxID=3104623 RepID=UPI00300B2270